MIDCSILYGLFCFLLFFSDLRQYVHAKPLVPCYFIFGDSLVDNGNNNHLDTIARADYFPYGIDFPNGPTGRYTNGRTIADLFGQYMGFTDFIPPFATANGKVILKGVNYASGSSGILNETSHHLGERIPLYQQLQNHKTTTIRIVDILGNEHIARRYLRRCLYLIATGSNDYINNYFLPHIYNTSQVYTPKQYARFLVNKYAQEIKILYDYGARKIAVNAVALIGCTPNATASYDTKGSICVNEMNDAVFLYNKKLQTLAHFLNDTLPGASVAYLQTYNIVPDYVSSQDSPLEILACCPVNDYGLCVPKEETCANGGMALFWDSFHPAEFANNIVAFMSYKDLIPIL